MTDEAITVDLQIGQRLLAEHERAPRLAGELVQVHIGAGPSDEHRDECVPTIASDLHVGPGLRIGQVVPHQRVVGPRRAESMLVDATVVLVIDRITGVEKAGRVGKPADRRGPGVGDLVTQVQTGLHVEHLEHAAFVAALGDPVGHEAAVGRRVIPVDRRRSVGRQGGRVEENHGRNRSIDRRTHDEPVLIGAARSFEGEYSLAGDTTSHRHRRAQQRDEALVPPTPIGPGIERLASAFVLGGDPVLRLGRLSVLEPAIRIGDRYTVPVVDDLLARRPWWRGQSDHNRSAAAHVRTLAVIRLVPAHARFFFFVFFDTVHQPRWPDRSSTNALTDQRSTR